MKEEGWLDRDNSLKKRILSGLHRELDLEWPHEIVLHWSKGVGPMHPLPTSPTHNLPHDDWLHSTSLKEDVG